MERTGHRDCVETLQLLRTIIGDVVFYTKQCDIGHEKTLMRRECGRDYQAVVVCQRR